ncbi:MAG: hypothetical protein Q9163_002662 [Psora crenata]
MANQYYPQPSSQPYNPQNLQFYQSSYPRPVSGHTTPSQAQYGYPNTQSHSAQGYPSSSGDFGGAPTFGGPGFGGPAVSGRMGEQGGLRTGWLAAFGTEGYDGEPPLLEELGVNFGHIKGKTLTVLSPLSPIPAHIMDDSDLAGPILFFLLFGTFLLFSGKVHFGYIYGLALVGSLSLHTIFSLMSPSLDSSSPTTSGYPDHGISSPYGSGAGDHIQAMGGGGQLSATLTFPRSASVLGYCLLPLVLTSFIGVVMPMDTAAGMDIPSLPKNGSANAEPDPDEWPEWNDRKERGSSVSSVENLVTQAVWSLPAKKLPRHNIGRPCRSLAVVGLTTTAIIVGLSVLASEVYHLEPATKWTSVSDTISCDLTTGNPSSVQDAFTINLRGGARLTFGEAKVIDLVWQLIVGGGGRLLMGWITYKAFMDGLVRLMEQTAVSYTLHTSLTFSTTSLLSIWHACRSIFTIRGIRGKCFLGWFAISTLYIVGFQSLISATAGYLQPSQAGFQMADGNFVDGNSDLLTSCFNVTSGALLNMTNGSIIGGPAVKDFDIVRFSMFNLGSFDTTFPHFETTFPAFADLVNDYTFQYGSDYVAQYCYNNHSMYGWTLKATAQCIQEPYFVWGLSSLLVKIVLAVQAVWVFGTFIVWLDANMFSDLCRNGRTVRGPFRATLDLSVAIREVLGDETCAYSDGQLEKELARQPGLRYYSDDVEESGTSHIGLSAIRIRGVQLETSKLYGTVTRQG